MATITLIAAAPFDDPPGVRLGRIDLPFLDVPPVRLWVHQYGDFDIYVVGQDEPIPAFCLVAPGFCRTLDIPLTAEEYEEYLDAVARATR